MLVGAQAIYEHTRDHAGDYAVSPFTFDADLTLIPELLVDDPRVIDAMRNAGFGLTDQPGIYRRDDGVQVDLLVPEAVGGRTGRGTGLGVHGNRAARQVRGLEGALVSRRPMTVPALADGDCRAYEVHVAGPLALLVAKVHKLMDRVDADDNRRINSKDAFDVFRLLQAVETVELIDEGNLLAAVEVSAEVTAEAMAGFRELFGTPTGSGTIPGCRTRHGHRGPRSDHRVQRCPQRGTHRRDRMTIPGGPQSRYIMLASHRYHRQLSRTPERGL